ncbi:MAG: 6,7-dimethyl-8-ribityllumazine synthase [Gammaproteobacteria bacterium]|nr:6,7-dimethyl-8-ribityllumazine synthase [Gammaproteobacteria bacterium]
MAHMIEGKLTGEGLKIAIVAARWNDFMGQKLVDGAIDTLIRHGVADDDISVVMVPGSYEIPFITKQVAQSGKYDAIVCIGVLIRGGTIHFDLIASEASKGIANVSMETGVPCTFGVITTESIEQAIERCGSKAGNKGAEAALAALELHHLGVELAGRT